MMSTELEKYYNKFCEEKRLTRRHGYVEYVTSMKYIHEYLPQGKKETKFWMWEPVQGVIRYSLPGKAMM